MNRPPAPRPPIRVKVCCIQDLAEARLAAAAGADALGLVSAMPSGPGPIAEERIAEIVRDAPAGVETWLLTCLVAPAEIAAQHERCGRPDAIQLCGALPPDAFPAVRAALAAAAPAGGPEVQLVQVVHVQGPATVAAALRYAPYADALLLDSGRPDADVPVLGGTGEVHDWTVSREIVRRAGVPVWLAGGLRPDNVAAAIRAVGPHGVDVCSGLRAQGRLVPQLVAEYLAAIAGAGR